jgi:hypothetical protein
MIYSRSALLAPAEPTTLALNRPGLAATLCRLLVTAGARAASFSTRAIFAASGAALLMSSAAQGGTIAVTNTNDNLAGSLRQAIQNATAGDTIVFQIPTTDPRYDAANGTFAVTLISAQLTISKSLTIDGAGQKITLERSSQAPNFRVFDVTAGDVVIANLTITRGSAPGGGGVRNAGNLTLRGCRVSANAGGSGGGGGLLNAAGGNAVISNCTFTNNTLTGIENDANGTVRLDNSTVVNHGAPVAGAGGIRNHGGAFRVRNTIIAENSGTYENVSGPFISEGFNFIGTTDGSTGFGAFGDQTGTTVSRADPKLGPLRDNGGLTSTRRPLPGSPVIDQGNRGTDTNGNPISSDQRGAPRPINQPAIANLGDGSDIGAVEVGLPQTGAVLTVTTIREEDDGICASDDCTFLEALNAANVSSDANEVVFAPNVIGKIPNTRAPDGLDLVHTLTITGPGARLLTIDGTDKSRLFEVLSGSTVTISGLTLYDGYPTGGSNDGSGNRGGAIANKGTLSISRCNFDSNGAGPGGGAIFNNGGAATLTVEDSTFSLNFAVGDGAAILNLATLGKATVSLTNCTFYNNFTAGGFAGAIYNDGNVDGTAAVTLTNCTLDGNDSNDQRTTGIFNDARNPSGSGTATVILRNTILRGPADSEILANDSDGRGTITSHGSNISTDAGGGFLNGPGDKPSTEPKLGAFQDHGGPTDTVSLLEGSPAINAGNDSFARATDQRGFARVGASDIGAFEFGGAVPTPTPAPTVTPPPPTPTPVPNRFANISTRVRVETGANALFGGFIVSGSQQKKIIVRAIGPSLEVEDRLANPLLELYNGNGELIAVNDNWREAENAQEIIDSTVAPSNELESAILRDVQLGAYTAQIRDVADGQGVALVEVYDFGAAQNSKLANIATRGRIQTGENIMIAGLIISGSSPQKVIVRAIGPSLQEVEGKLEDPVLELYDRNGELMAANNNWRDTQEAEVATTTIPPSHDLESAIVAFLPPDLYTAQVRGAGDTTGVGIVEVYALE